MSAIDTVLAQGLDNHRSAWSIGTLGAVGEFVRDSAESARRTRNGRAQEIVTSRGGLRIVPTDNIRIIAYDMLASDGETWNQAVAFCLPAGQTPPHSVNRLGQDHDALRAEDREHSLFDLGACMGLVQMCVRTRDTGLIAALDALRGQSLFAPGSAKAAQLVLELSPHRVLLSPIGRVEVYAPIPKPGGASPMGPHTHLLPKLIQSGRAHAANAPIPAGLQPVLMLHPGSPWRDAAGKRVPFDAALDAEFEDILRDHGLPEDRAIRGRIEAAVKSGADPESLIWPETRRGRIQARIVLRRLSVRLGEKRLAPWRTLYDRAQAEEREDEPEPAL